MPATRQRNGNGLVKSVSYELSTGVQPSVCELTLGGACQARIGQAIHVQVMGSEWQGLVRSCIDSKSVLGRETEIRGIDMREYLMGAATVARVNMIDEEDGSVTSEWDELLSHSANDSTTYSAQAIIEKLLSCVTIFTFTAEYSDKCRERISLASVTGNWAADGGNLYNLDWGNGIKVGHALEQVCEALSIVPVLRNVTATSATMRFVVVGEQDAQFSAWEALYAIEHSNGTAMAPESETGVYVLGDHDAYELQEWEWEPAWNQAWNKYVWNYPLLIGLLEKLDAAGFHSEATLLSAFNRDTGAAYSHFSNAGDAATAELLNTLYDDTEYAYNKKAYNLTIAEYYGTIPFKAYRLPTMYSTTDRKILTPLPSDPSVSCIVKGWWTSWADKENRRLLQQLYYSEDETLSEESYSLDDRIGVILFAKRQFRLTTAGKQAVANKTSLTHEHIVPDAPKVTCATFGTVFKKFYGTSERVTVKRVGGLRRVWNVNAITNREGIDEMTAAILESGDTGLFANVTLKPLGAGDKSADKIADEIAESILARSKTITSGEATFRGIAGFHPSGEIRRVRVSVSESAGIEEHVSYANDMPSFNRISLYETQQRVLTHINARAASIERASGKRLTLQRLTSAVRAAAKGGAAETRKENLAIEWAWIAGMGDKDGNLVIIKVPNEDTYEIGSPIRYQSSAFADQALESCTDTAENGRSPMAIVVSASGSTASGENFVIARIAGETMALVRGPIETGQPLVAMDGVELYRGFSSQCMAMDRLSDSGASLIMVKLVPPMSQSGPNAISARVATTENISLAGTPVIDEVATAEWDTVLVKDQSDTAENGLYIIHPSYATWVRATQIMVGASVTVREGTENKGVWLETQSTFAMDN